MRLCRHGLAVALAIASLAAVPAARGSTAPEYESIRARHTPTRVQDLKIVEQNLEHFLGHCVEFGGVITGRMQSKERDRLLLKVGESGTASIAVANDVPQMAIGSQVRVIAQPATGRTGLTYTLVAIAWESELAAREPKTRAAIVTAPIAQPQAAPAAAAPAQAPSKTTAAYAAMIQRFNKRLSKNEATQIATAILDFSARQGLDARLVMAVVAAESNFNPSARSRAGAMGLGQLMPATARGMGVSDPWDYRQNLDGAVRLIKGHLANNSGDLALALACYNAGSGAVRRHGGVPPYAETQNYIRKVVSLFLAFAPEYAADAK